MDKAIKAGFGLLLMALVSGWTHGGGSVAPSFTAAWQSAKICCGGLLNNIQVSTSDGTIVASANTYGAYLYKTTGTCAAASSTSGWGTGYAAPCWEQLFTSKSISGWTLASADNLNQGVLEIDSCNNNTNDAYAFFNGNLWVTTNLLSSSRTWAQTTLTTSIGGNQGISAGTGRAIVCDPNNPNVVYAATLVATYRAANGLSGASATFSSISGIGTTGVVPSVIAIDPASSTGTCAALSGSPTCSLHFWIFTSGSGVYETYNGGSTFTLTTSGPTTAGSSCGQGGHCLRLAADKFSQLWASIGDAKLYKYVPNGTAGGGTWTNSTPGVNNANVVEFAVDPSSASSGANRIVATNSDGLIALSTNNAGAWTGFNSSMSFSSSGSQPAWMGVANQLSGGVMYLALQDIIFDGSGNLWSAAGIGVWEILSASVSVSGTWLANDIGQEQLVANRIIAPPGNSPVAAVWDRGFYLLKNPDTFPTTYYPTAVGGTQPIQGGWAIDYASLLSGSACTSCNFLTGWVGSSASLGASSSDGGVTWAAWPAQPSPNNIGGSIAAADATHWIVVPGNNETLNYTINGGTSWTPLTVTGATTPFSSNTGYRTPLAADRVAATTYCIVDAGTGVSGNQKFFVSTAGTPSFSAAAGVGSVDGITYNDQLKSAPGQSGHFLYSAGNSGGSNTGFHMWKSTNTCATWANVNSGMTNVYAFGFGAAKPGGSGYPAIYAYATISSTAGIYESDDAGSTWTLVPNSTWPNNSLDFIKDVSGDMNVYGRIYVGENGSGFAYLDKQDACPWVNFSNTNPNASLTGASVTLTAAKSGLVPVSGVNFYLDGTTQIGSTQTGAGPYSVSFNASGQTVGSHTLTVSPIGGNSNCPAYNTTSNRFVIPITTH